MVSYKWQRSPAMVGPRAHGFARVQLTAL